MARFESSTFGKISGKHGTSVAAIRKDGLCILKVYRVASNPNTGGQKTQRGKFGFAMKQLNCFRGIISQTSGSQYGLNKVLGHAVKTAISGKFPDFILDYGSIQISIGSLAKTATIQVRMSDSNILSVNWNINEETDIDTLHIVLLQALTKEIMEKKISLTQTEGQFLLEIPQRWLGDTIHAWVYFSSTLKRTYSTSQYISVNK